MSGKRREEEVPRRREVTFCAGSRPLGNRAGEGYRPAGPPPNGPGVLRRHGLAGRGPAHAARHPDGLPPCFRGAPPHGGHSAPGRHSSHPHPWLPGRCPGRSHLPHGAQASLDGGPPGRTRAPHAGPPPFHGEEPRHGRRSRARVSPPGWTGASPHGQEPCRGPGLPGGGCPHRSAPGPHAGGPPHAAPASLRSRERDGPGPSPVREEAESFRTSSAPSPPARSGMSPAPRGRRGPCAAPRRAARACG